MTGAALPMRCLPRLRQRVKTCTPKNSVCLDAAAAKVAPAPHGFPATRPLLGLRDAAAGTLPFDRLKDVAMTSAEGEDRSSTGERTRTGPTFRLTRAAGLRLTDRAFTTVRP